ncbi:SDR family NAD(P)-dependent oxidoreductase [Calothrix sp. UHCC 0171]|uniref:SDR family NAD(P)-dependent oxidoreductase n=1 Tax=Calothrix sp. UHCC 0171 TaxID=3110245 RepID=UPI002B21F059|nr:SDR family NAD(P)-dependent oxidoreductase [Calothrix sp. UHCC 0171]MEA5570750.1 SDR family NAD(P)-dependent oxidoreductase [Calothrix sp. UHCC 0171]
MSFLDANASKNHPINTLVIGASRGIGLGFVEKLLSDSRINKVYATYRKPESASGLLALVDAYPHKLTCILVDIIDEIQIAECVGKIRADTDKLHFAINCAGLLHDENLQPEKSLRQINLDNLTRYFQINSIASVLLAKHLQPLFKHKENSVFASISAKVGSIVDNQLGGWYGYRASKTALNMLMRNVSIEYARTCPKTIVVTLHPGTTDTNLSRPFQKNVAPEKLFTVERTVNQLLTVIEQLEPSDTGHFFSWDGSKLPW